MNPRDINIHQEPEYEDPSLSYRQLPVGSGPHDVSDYYATPMYNDSSNDVDQSETNITGSLASSQGLRNTTPKIKPIASGAPDIAPPPVPGGRPTQQASAPGNIDSNAEILQKNQIANLEGKIESLEKSITRRSRCFILIVVISLAIILLASDLMAASIRQPPRPSATSKPNTAISQCGDAICYNGGWCENGACSCVKGDNCIKVCSLPNTTTAPTTDVSQENINQSSIYGNILLWNTTHNLTGENVKNGQHKCHCKVPNPTYCEWDSTCSGRFYFMFYGNISKPTTLPTQSTKLDFYFCQNDCEPLTDCVGLPKCEPAKVIISDIYNLALLGDFAVCQGDMRNSCGT